MGQGFSSLLEFLCLDLKLNRVQNSKTTYPSSFVTPPYSQLDGEWAQPYLTSDEWIGISFDPSTSTNSKLTAQDGLIPTSTASAFDDNFLSNLPLDLTFDLEGFDYPFCEKSPSTIGAASVESATLEKPSTSTATTVETTPVLSFSNSSSPLTLSPNDLLLPTTPTDSTDLHSEALQRQQSQLSNTNSISSFDSIPPCTLPPSFDIPPIRINVSRPESMMGPSYKSTSVSASSASPEPTSMSRTSSSRHSTKSTSSKSRFKDIPDPLAPNTPATVVKRARNTLAARRYRAKKVERMEQLEEQLAEMEAERDRWKNEAMQARLEAEKWKGMWVGANMGGNVNVNHHG